MVWNIGFYKSADWPAETGTTTNGGAIAVGSPLTGTLNEIFLHATSGYTGQSDHVVYRKIFAKNNDANSILNTSMFLENAKYPGHLMIAAEKSASDTSTNPKTMPGGYSESDFKMADGTGESVSKIVGGTTTTVGSAMGLWVRLKIPSGLREADDYVPANLVLIGDR